MKNKEAHDRILPFRAVDRLLIAYYLVVGIYIIIGAACGRLQNWPIFTIHHVVVIILLTVFIPRIRQDGRSATAFLRLFYPILLSSLMYRETHEIDQILFSQPIDLYFAEWDKILFNCQPSIAFATRFGGALFSEIMHFGYFSYFGFIVLLPLLWWFKRRPDMVERRVFDMAFTYSIFSLIFIILPVQGPRVQLPGAIGMARPGYIFAPFFGWLFKAAGIAGAAFPSSHCGITTVVLANCTRDFPKIAPFAAILAVMLFLATVYGRFHYGVDVIYGIGLGLICFIVSPYVFKSLQRKNGLGDRDYS
jgi:membrane-associated phospholipid phosphatase